MNNTGFNGEKYRQASTHQKEWGNKIIAELNPAEDARILDLGCGDGVLTAGGSGQLHRRRQLRQFLRGGEGRHGRAAFCPLLSKLRLAVVHA